LETERFRPQVRGDALLGPFERANLNYWKTDPVSETLSFLDFRILDDGQTTDSDSESKIVIIHTLPNTAGKEHTNLYIISGSGLPNPSISTTTNRYHHSTHVIQIVVLFWFY
jgi:hypothetical protein